MMLKEELLTQHVRLLKEDNAQLLDLCEAQTKALRLANAQVKEARGWARRLYRNRCTCSDLLRD